MSNEKTYSVTINAARKIPFINKNGPISSPINITKSVLEDLVKMGFPVVIRSETLHQDFRTHENLHAQQV